jgi:hypothetical protein
MRVDRCEDGDHLRVEVRKGYFTRSGLTRYEGRRYFEARQRGIGNCAEKRTGP